MAKAIAKDLAALFQYAPGFHYSLQNNRKLKALEREIAEQLSLTSELANNIEAELLRRRALYSHSVPIYRLALVIGMLKPVRCRRCRAWFLVESEPQGDDR